MKTALEAVVAGDANDAKSALLLAHTNLWKLAEWGRDPKQDAAKLPVFALEAKTYFTKVRALDPSDARVLGWLGAVDVGTGKATNDAALVKEGEDLIAQGVAAHPEFNLFVQMLVSEELPASDPKFAAGVEAMWTTLDLCAGEKVDRKNPDFSKYAALETTMGPKRVCWNGEAAPHNYEGFFLYMGDLLVKQNDAATAKILYANAKSWKTAASWPFLAELDQRVAGADARAALYADADPSNDPPLAGATPTQCATCHASK